MSDPSLALRLLRASAARGCRLAAPRAEFRPLPARTLEKVVVVRGLVNAQKARAVKGEARPREDPLIHRMYIPIYTVADDDAPRFANSQCRRKARTLGERSFFLLIRPFR